MRVSRRPMVALAVVGPLWAANFVPITFVPIEDRSLGMPVQGMRLSDLRDTFNEARAGGRRHQATDIPAARGTPVLAVEDGTIRKLFLSKPGWEHDLRV
jgi:peptidoglycan LD-endopeptidase LytH